MNVLKLATGDSLTFDATPFAPGFNVVVANHSGAAVTIEDGDSNKVIDASSDVYTQITLPAKLTGDATNDVYILG